MCTLCDTLYDHGRAIGTYETCNYLLDKARLTNSPLNRGNRLFPRLGQASCEPTTATYSSSSGHSSYNLHTTYDKASIKSTLTAITESKKNYLTSFRSDVLGHPLPNQIRTISPTPILSQPPFLRSLHLQGMPDRPSGTPCFRPYSAAS